MCREVFFEYADELIYHGADVSIADNHLLCKIDIKNFKQLGCTRLVNQRIHYASENWMYILLFETSEA